MQPCTLSRSITRDATVQEITQNFLEIQTIVRNADRGCLVHTFTVTTDQNFNSFISISCLLSRWSLSHSAFSIYLTYSNTVVSRYLDIAYLDTPAISIRD